MLDRDVVATELFAELMQSYPQNASGNLFVKDSCYIASQLIKHLRNTRLGNKALTRNVALLKALLKNTRYQNRADWVAGMKEVLENFFPIIHHCNS